MGNLENISRAKPRSCTSFEINETKPQDKMPRLTSERSHSTHGAFNRCQVARQQWLWSKVTTQCVSCHLHAGTQAGGEYLAFFSDCRQLSRCHDEARTQSALRCRFRPQSAYATTAGPSQHVGQLGMLQKVHTDLAG